MAGTLTPPMVYQNSGFVSTEDWQAYINDLVHVNLGFTTGPQVTVKGDLLLNTQTANAIPYLDGSKIIQTSANLTFDDTDLTITANVDLGTSPIGYDGSAGGLSFDSVNQASFSTNLYIGTGLAADYKIQINAASQNLVMTYDESQARFYWTGCDIFELPYFTFDNSGAPFMRMTSAPAVSASGLQILGNNNGTDLSKMHFDHGGGTTPRMFWQVKSAGNWRTTLVTQAVQTQVYGVLLVNRDDNDSTASMVEVQKDRSGSIVQNGDGVGRIAFQGYDGNAYIDAGWIECFVDGVPGLTDMPGKIQIGTTPDGAGVPVIAIAWNNAQETIFYGNIDLALNPIGYDGSAGGLSFDASNNATLTDNLTMTGAKPIYFRDTAIGIYSQADTFMDLFADGAVRIGNSAAGAPTTYLKIEPDGTTSVVGANLVLPKTTNVGIKVDTASPTFGWKDLLGDIKTRPAAGGGAAAQPDFAVYRGSIYAYRFGTTAPNNHLHECFVEFHIPHDYVPGSDIYIHTHWSQIVVDTGGAASAPGVSEWFFDVTYAKGYGTAGGAGDPFIAPITTSVVCQGSTTQYAHMICEVQLSDPSPSASQLDSDNLEVDGLLLVRAYRTPSAGNDTLDQDAFLHYVDVHYQSTNMATKDKNTPFYT